MQNVTRPLALRRGLATAAVLTASLTMAACGQSAPTPTASGSATLGASPSAGATAPTASATPSATATKPVTKATNLDGITVAGAPAKVPTVKVPAPWQIDKTQTKVLTPGTGDTVPTNGTVLVYYHGVNGRTGQVFDSSLAPSARAVPFSLKQVVPGFKKGLEGQKVGSRVLIGMPGSDGYDASGGTQDGQIKPGDSLLFVVDILGTSLTGPQGTPVAAKAGLPTVTADATPTLTLPAGYKAPAATVAQPIIQGTGRAVGAADLITVNYQQVSLKTGKVVAQSYGISPETGQLAGLITGWKKGLVGQKVGSRVLLVVPKAEADPAGDDLAFVVDILFTAPMPQ